MQHDGGGDGTLDGEYHRWEEELSERASPSSEVGRREGARHVAQIAAVQVTRGIGHDGCGDDV